MTEQEAFLTWHKRHYGENVIATTGEETAFQAGRSYEAERAKKEEFTLLGVIADIRKKTGVGDKPMLSELADILAARPCPHVYTGSGGTSHCTLAAKEAERAKELVEASRDLCVMLKAAKYGHYLNIEYHKPLELLAEALAKYEGRK